MASQPMRTHAHLTQTWQAAQPIQHAAASKGKEAAVAATSVARQASAMVSNQAGPLFQQEAHTAYVNGGMMLQRPFMPSYTPFMHMVSQPAMASRAEAMDDDCEWNEELEQQLQRLTVHTMPASDQDEVFLSQEEAMAFDQAAHELLGDFQNSMRNMEDPVAQGRTDDLEYERMAREWENYRPTDAADLLSAQTSSFASDEARDRLARLEQYAVYPFQETNVLQEKMTEAAALTLVGDYMAQFSGETEQTGPRYTLGDAILAAETAIQHRMSQQQDQAQEGPSMDHLWYLLGSLQAENEKEQEAISALRQCTQLNPDHLDAYLALAASYTNEGLRTEAFDSLRQFLGRNPRYRDQLPDRFNTGHINGTPGQDMFEKIWRSSVEGHQDLDFDSLSECYMAAARSSVAGGDLDPDVQLGLGILFHLQVEFEKSVDCFRAALSVRPEVRCLIILLFMDCRITCFGTSWVQLWRMRRRARKPFKLIVGPCS